MPISTENQGRGRSSAVERSETLSQLISAYSRGDKGALLDLFPLVYQDLKRLAHHHLSGNRRDLLMQTTALVHDVYERLVKNSGSQIISKNHFFALCSRAIRQIIIDQYRRHSAKQRAGSAEHVQLDSLDIGEHGSSIALLAMGEALESLSEQDERMVQVFEMTHFGGLSRNEISDILEIDVRTVYRDLSKARAWISRSLKS